MHKVFISYHHCSPDEELARELHRLLRSEGIQPFIDTAIPPGTRWEAELAARLEQSDCFIVILSDQSILSDMVREEVRRAHKRSRAGDTMLLPVWVDGLSDLPYDLGAWLNPVQHARWRAGDEYEGLARTLRSAIAGQTALPLIGTAAPATTQPGDLGAPVEAGAPLIAADPRPFMEAGALPLRSRYYVRRSHDDDVEEQLALPMGRTVIVRGPRQSGKSSLLARARAFAAGAGQRTCYLDFQALDDAALSGIDPFLRAVAMALQQEFSTATKLDSVWDSDRSARENVRGFLQRAVLRGAPVTLLFDEVDRVFRQPWHTGFFAELRHWHNCRAMIGAPWDRLSLVLAHSTDPALWIDTGDQSPFNVADLNVWLEDFGDAELAELNRLYGHPLGSVDELRRVFGGQPYLARLALYTLKTEGVQLSELSDRALQPKSAFSSHLRRHLLLLQRHPELSLAVRQIMRRETFEDDQAFDRLFSAGLVRGDGPRQAKLRCELYVRYFANHL